MLNLYTFLLRGGGQVMPTRMSREQSEEDNYSDNSDPSDVEVLEAHCHQDVAYYQGRTS